MSAGAGRSAILVPVAPGAGTVGQQGEGAVADIVVGAGGREGVLAVVQLGAVGGQIVQVEVLPP